MKLLVILPAFNEEKVIGPVLVRLKKEIKRLEKKFKLKSKLIIVDDGSTDKTYQIAKKQKVSVLRHILNRGLGGALMTGFHYARKTKADIALTMDSDGQHDPQDIKKLILPIIKGQADVVIGSRTLSKNGKMPPDRKILVFGSNILTFLLFGIITSDSQSGFRALNKKALSLIRLQTQRMEVSSEIFAEIKKNRLGLKEVPIKVIYTDYSRKKGQSNLNSLQILLKLILKLAR
jgi:glycosyltransferase involved in cell wall biosynthesis